MSTLNVVKTTNMDGVSSRPWREQWRFYKRCHPLAVEYQAARHGNMGPLTQFIQQCLRPGRIIAIDSFAPAVSLIHPVERWVELDSFDSVTKVWAPEISDSIFPKNSVQYSTVVMLGEQWTKYQTQKGMPNWPATIKNGYNRREI